MKKITLLLAFMAIAWTGCSGDDSDPVNNDSYSAHMKSTCPESSPTYDVCVSESVYEYLGEQRAAAGVNNCLMITFEGLDGEVYEDYLIRVEKNKVNCTSEE